MVTNSQGSIITFYSYKGGVGRSMILANIAWILASNGKRVLVIDWDLEAPGLHHYFHPFLLDKDLIYTEGLIDFLTDFIDAALTPADESEGDDENWHEAYANIRRYAVSLDWKFPNKGAIDFVPVGKQGHLYAKRVNSFDWQNFYERFGGGRFLETVKEKMRAEYDYILIDSRTGVSDTSGICTVQMPDIVVIVFMANNQSISGAVKVATSVSKQWQADNSRSQNQWAIFPVLARTDRTEKDKLDLTRGYIKNKFAPFLQHLSETEREEYWGNVEIPYIPWYAYEEVLVTFRDNPYQRDSLLAAIEQLVSYLTHKEVSELVAPNQEEREKILSQFTRQLNQPVKLPTNFNSQSLVQLIEIKAYFEKQVKAEFENPRISPFTRDWQKGIDLLFELIKCPIDGISLYQGLLNALADVLINKPTDYNALVSFVNYLEKYLTLVGNLTGQTAALDKPLTLMPLIKAILLKELPKFNCDHRAHIDKYREEFRFVAHIYRAYCTRNDIAHSQAKDWAGSQAMILQNRDSTLVVFLAATLSHYQTLKNALELK